MSGSRGGFSVVISAQDDASARIAAINKKLAEARAPTARLGKEFDKLASNVGLRDVSKYAKDLQDRFAKIAGSLGSMGPLTGALLGAGGVADVISAAKSVAGLGTSLLLSAQQAGVHVAQLQRLGYAADMAGGSADGATQSYIALNRNMQLSRAGALNDGAWYSAIGKVDPNFRNQTPAQAMNQVLHGLAAMKNVTQQMTYGNAIFGGSFAQLWPVISQGEQALDQYLRTASTMPAMSDQQAAAAKQTQGSFSHLTDSVTTLAETTIVDLFPAIGSASGGMAGWLDANNRWLATDISGRIRTYTSYINAAAAAIGGWKAASSDLLEYYIGTFFPGIIGGALRADAVLSALGKYAQGKGWTDQKNWATGQDEGPQNIGSFSGSWASFRNDVLDAPQSFGLDALTKAFLTTKPISSAREKAIRDQGMAFWMSRGLTRAQAAGIQGNAEQESGFNPAASNGSHFGLFQWSKDRALAIKRATGIDVSTAPAADQYTAAWYELNHGYSATLARLKSAKNSWQASDIFNTGFEVSVDNSGLQRGLYSEAINSDATPMILSPGGGAPGAPGGQVTVHVKISGAPPGTRVSTTSSGAAIKGKPKVLMSMPAGGHQ